MEYQLSAVLEGHGGDVRALLSPNHSLIISASRDATFRTWNLLPSQPLKYNNITLQYRLKLQADGYGHLLVNEDGSIDKVPAVLDSVAYIPPFDNYPEGLIACGGFDNTIQIVKPSHVFGEKPEAILKKIELGPVKARKVGGIESDKYIIKELLGRIFSMDVSEEGRFLVSGNSDNSTKIWQIGTWKLLQNFPGPEKVPGEPQQVSAVLAFNKDTIIIGSSDNMIRIHKVTGELEKIFQASDTPIRALCKLPANHVSNAHFASGANDGIIRLWSIEGEEKYQLHGHFGYIYALAVLSDGRIVSSSDHQVKIWEGTECVQTITYPAREVWSMTVCAETDDIITGGSDKVIRIFSKSPERQDPIAVESFSGLVDKALARFSYFPENYDAVGAGPRDIPTENGIRNGQVVEIVQLDGRVSTHRWDGTNWAHLGFTFIPCVEEKRKRAKKIYQGKTYDQVWNIEIGDGSPSPPKLAMNYSQTAEEAADSFLAENPQLNVPENRRDIIAFVKSATQGIELGIRTKLQVELDYLPIFDISPTVLPKLKNKIIEFNTSLNQTGFEDVSLNKFLKTTDLEGHPWNINSDADDAVRAFLDATLNQLAMQPSNNSPLPNASIDVVLHMCKSWPQAMRFPALNLLGNVAAFYSLTLIDRTSSGSKTLIDYLFDADIFAIQAPPNNILMATRALANLFKTTHGLSVVGPSFDRLHAHLGPFVSLAATNFNFAAALTTLYCNYAVISYKHQDPGRGLQILEVIAYILSSLLPKIDNGPQTLQAAVYRGTTALKAVLSQDVEELRKAARGVLEINSLLRKMDGKGGEDLQLIKTEVAELMWRS